MSSGAVNSYWPGQSVKIESTWTIKLSGAAYDPEVLRFKYRPAAGNLVEYVYGTDAEITRIGDGQYRVFVVTTDNPGLWRYRWEAETSAGVPQMTIEHSFQVKPSKVL